MQLLSALIEYFVALLASSTSRFLSLDSALDDCQLAVPLRRSQAGPSRAVPIVSNGGSALVWQDGDSIYLQRYEAGCNTKGNVAELFHSEDFWQRPFDNGLEDALALGGDLDSIIVSWTLNSSVWILNVGGPKPSQPVQVNRYEKSEQVGIRLQSAPNGGFVSVWTSWQEDGDGWGIFMQAFSREVERIGDVIQVNSIWKHFQWRPSLRKCGQATYAAWINSTADCVDEGCNTGPFSRRIAPFDSTKHEASLLGVDPEEVHLACNDNDTWAFWLDDHAIAYNKVNGNNDVPEVGAVIALPPPKGELASLLSSALRDTFRSRRLQGSGSSAGAKLVYTNNWQLLIVGDDGDGNLATQLVNLESHQIHPQRRLAESASLLQAIWDESGQKFVSCWTSYGSPGLEFTRIVCARHGISWLTDATYWGAGGVLAVIAVACVLCILLCWKQRVSNSNAAGRRARTRNLLRGLNRPGQRQTRQNSGPTPQQREIEAQLARIPQVAPALPPPETEENAQGGEEGEASSSPPVQAPPPPTPGPPCIICQEDMLSVRVAFNPCGHWACRTCAERLFQTRQKCHLCRANVESILPVFY